jgi:hypothetical protein
MKTAIVTILLMSIWATGGPAQEQNSEGAVWDMQFIRTKPNQRDAYLLSLKQNAKPIWEEERRQGLILDYKIFNNLTQHDPQEWDIAVAIQFKNFAALDGFEAKELSIASKRMGSASAANQEFGEKHVEMREIVSTKLIQEILLK